MRRGGKMKVLRIILIIVAIALLAFCAYVAISFFGNPILIFSINDSAKTYIEEKYPDSDFTVEGAFYNFKLGYYSVNVYDPELVDCYFSLYYDGEGKLKNDTYSGRYLSGFNTALRIDGEYNSLVDSVFASEEFGYDSDISFGFIEFTDKAGAVGAPEYAVPYSELIIDGENDARELGRRAGVITVNINTDDCTVEALASILLSIRDIFDGEGVPFRAIDITLSSEDGRRVSLFAFDYADIYEDGLVLRVGAAALSAERYIDELEREKEAELRGE